MQQTFEQMTPDFPIEFIVYGTPVSLQARGNSKAEWKERVREASRMVLEPGHWASEGPISATIFYFPEDQMVGDIDNIVKPILDALNAHIYVDDEQVERVVVQKFEAGRLFVFSNPSEALDSAIQGQKPSLYIHISNDPHEGLT